MVLLFYRPWGVCALAWRRNMYKRLLCHISTPWWGLWPDKYRLVLISLIKGVVNSHQFSHALELTATWTGFHGLIEFIGNVHALTKIKELGLGCERRWVQELVRRLTKSHGSLIVLFTASPRRCSIVSSMRSFSWRHERTWRLLICPIYLNLQLSFSRLGFCDVIWLEEDSILRLYADKFTLNMQISLGDQWILIVYRLMNNLSQLLFLNWYFISPSMINCLTISEQINLCVYVQALDELLISWVFTTNWQLSSHIAIM